MSDEWASARHHATSAKAHERKALFLLGKLSGRYPGVRESEQAHRAWVRAIEALLLVSIRAPRA